MIQEGLSVTFASQAQSRVQSRVLTSNEGRVFLSPRHPRPMTGASNATFVKAASSLPIQRVCLYYRNQFNSILAKAIDNSTSSTVHR